MRTCRTVTGEHAHLTGTACSDAPAMGRGGGGGGGGGGVGGVWGGGGGMAPKKNIKKLGGRGQYW